MLLVKNKVKAPMSRGSAVPVVAGAGYSWPTSPPFATRDSVHAGRVGVHLERQTIDPEMLDNICGILTCKRHEVKNFTPIEEGLTNSSFTFSVAGMMYVYRHPGSGTEEIINRRSEAYSQSVAKKLGIDETFMYEDVDRGWKLSHYVADCAAFDYRNSNHVSRGMDLIRKLHRSGEVSEWHFDLYDNAQEIKGLLGSRSYPAFPDYELLSNRIERLGALVKGDGVLPCLCHNDVFNPNFLVKDDVMYLIDWEYSAMSDYASDVGSFICCSDYNDAEATSALEAYFKRTPTRKEYQHCIAYVALAAYYWFIWALYKESTGDSAGEWLYRWHACAQAYSQKALKLRNA